MNSYLLIFNEFRKSNKQKDFSIKMDLRGTSLDTFMYHIKLWQSYGLYPINYKNKSSKIAHEIFLVVCHLAFTIYHPISLIMKMDNTDDIKGMIDNISMISVLEGVLVKMCIVKFNSSKFTRICMLSCEFHEKHSSDPFAKEQQNIFRNKSRKYFQIYFVTYSFIIAFEGLKIFALNERTLLHPAYFPFDPFSNAIIYNCVNWFQFLGWAFLGVMNIYVDSYPSMLIYNVKQNVKILGNRISKIGEDPSENAHEHLRDAIKDYHRLNELFDLTTSFLSPAMFTMFASVFINLVFSVLLATFFTDNSVEVMFVVLYVSGTQMEISLPCYYGSQFVAENKKFIECIYSCNWTEQSKQFKQDLIVLTELCLREKSFFAGGLFPISLESFVRIVKGAYSFYTVLSNMAG